MTWTERLKSTFVLLKDIALPLYIWYLIYFALFGIIMIIFSILPPVENFMQALEYLDQNELILGHDLLKQLPLFSILFILMAGIGLIMTSLLYTGTYHLTVKGFKGKAKFRDFKLTNAKKMIGWNFLILLFFLVVISAGILFFAFLSVFSETASYAFMIIFPIFVILFSLYLVPWILSAGYYILAYRELPFGKALAHSWSFFRKNMFHLWGAALAMFFINIVIVLMQEVSSAIGGMISFIATPFFFLIPIVWTLTLISEQERIGPLDSDLETPNNPVQHDSPYHDSPYHESPYHGESSDIDESSNIGESPYHDDFPEIITSLPHYKPSKEESPPGYYHVPDRLDKSSDTELNFCPTCGTKVRSSAAYCAKCGLKVR